jgi:hypothetical protein
VFGSVVAVAFQNAFHSEVHQIYIYIYLKLFLTSAHQNELKTPKNINLKQIKNKKILKFLKNAFKT